MNNNDTWLKVILNIGFQIGLVVAGIYLFDVWARNFCGN